MIQTNVILSSALILIKSDYNISSLSNFVSIVIVKANNYLIGPESNCYTIKSFVMSNETVKVFRHLIHMFIFFALDLSGPRFKSC